jgi:hypothetical protein
MRGSISASADDGGDLGGEPKVNKLPGFFPPTGVNFTLRSVWLRREQSQEPL